MCIVFCANCFVALKAMFCFHLEQLATAVYFKSQFLAAACALQKYLIKTIERASTVCSQYNDL